MRKLIILAIVSLSSIALAACDGSFLAQGEVDGTPVNAELDFYVPTMEAGESSGNVTGGAVETVLRHNIGDVKYLDTITENTRRGNFSNNPVAKQWEGNGSGSFAFDPPELPDPTRGQPEPAWVLWWDKTDPSEELGGQFSVRFTDGEGDEYEITDWSYNSIRFGLDSPGPIQVEVSASPGVQWIFRTIH